MTATHMDILALKVGRKLLEWSGINLKGGQVNGYFAGRRAEVQQFMAQQECSWCASPLKVRIMSKFNTDAICMSCKNKERAHPDYPKAEAAERAAVMAGDFNFPGIGKPVDL